MLIKKLLSKKEKEYFRITYKDEGSDKIFNTKIVFTSEIEARYYSGYLNSSYAGYCYTGREFGYNSEKSLYNPETHKIIKKAIHMVDNPDELKVLYS